MVQGRFCLSIYHTLFILMGGEGDGSPLMIMLCYATVDGKRVSE